MIDTPKLMTGPNGEELREQTLAEYCMALPPGHLALRELTELQRHHHEMLRLRKELENWKKLQEEVPPQTVQAVENVRDPSFDPLKKVPCIICGKPIALGKGYWKRHLMSTHPTADPTLEQV